MLPKHQRNQYMGSLSAVQCQKEKNIKRDCNERRKMLSSADIGRVCERRYKTMFPRRKNTKLGQKK